jgi:murein DD-endopeptidase MepM/ murein hydrolase activator NlpD
MRLLIRCLVLCLMVTAAAVPAGARGRPTPPPQAPAAPSDSQNSSVAALKAQAKEAAAKYSQAQTDYARLGDQVDALQQQIAGLEGRLAPLRQEITRQAVAVYQGDVAAAAVSHFEAVAAMMRSDRAAHLVADLTARDVPAIDALLGVRQRLRDRQSDLEARRHEQDITMASLAGQRDQISRELEQLAAAQPVAAPPPRRPAPRASRSASGLGQRLTSGVAGVSSFICPIDGPLTFTDDFGAPRGGGRRHMGNDLLSPKGTLNVAVVTGTIETRPWAGGGITIFLHGDDGNTYVYMHLLQIEGAVPRRVLQGDVIGLTGATGHAFGYHTHFEFHPGGGDAISPYPLISAAG